MRLPLTYEVNEGKTIADKPDCVDEFQNQLVTGRDLDPDNNPHEFKFRDTYYSGDGWEFEFEPLAKQETKVACDISYKFLYGSFEIRGKNFPDSKFGKDGGGLREESKDAATRLINGVSNALLMTRITNGLPVGGWHLSRGNVCRNALESAGGNEDGAASDSTGFYRQYDR
ncbi:MAG: hypothetical protein LQ337_006304 [Flavoplaca oasis]|nr:MAG: hypothetical protein LQ337_006304 [Flavoplaca oasis]